MNGATSCMRCLLLAAVTFLSSVSLIQCVQFRIIGIAFAVVALHQNRAFIRMTVSTKSQVDTHPAFQVVAKKSVHPSSIRIAKICAMAHFLNN